jgi:hypothetical protein
MEAPAVIYAHGDNMQKNATHAEANDDGHVWLGRMAFDGCEICVQTNHCTEGSGGETVDVRSKLDQRSKCETGSAEAGGVSPGVIPRYWSLSRRGSGRMRSRSDAVPRHNGALIGMRITLHHDFHALATAVSGSSSLFLLLWRDPDAWRGASIAFRQRCKESAHGSRYTARAAALRPLRAR